MQNVVKAMNDLGHRMSNPERSYNRVPHTYGTTYGEYGDDSQSNTGPADMNISPVSIEPRPTIE